MSITSHLDELQVLFLVTYQLKADLYYLLHLSTNFRQVMFLRFLENVLLFNSRMGFTIWGQFLPNCFNLDCTKSNIKFNSVLIELS